MLLHKMKNAEVINPPHWLIDNTHYLVIHGSYMYGINTETSDKDVYGWCIPQKELIFPHLGGEIMGFGIQKERWNQWQSQAKIVYNREEYDISVYNIVRFFHLCMENNPNVLETLFAPIDCVLHNTKLGNIVRERRKDFLHKGIYPKLKGYSYSQLSKMKSKDRIGKRKETVEQWGFDLKFASHVVRLLDEAEQVLTVGDLDLRKNREQLKSIRRGEWTVDEVINWADAKEKQLEELYVKCDFLPWGPDEKKIKQLLLDILEEHYGSLDNCVSRDESVYKEGLEKIQKICNDLGIIS